MIVYNDTRSNAKRHFCVRQLLYTCFFFYCLNVLFFFQDHDPTKELNHAHLWLEACLQMKNQTQGKSNGDSRTSIPTKFVVTQADLDDWVLV